MSIIYKKICNCSECNNKIEIFVCDSCKKEMENPIIEVFYGYGHSKDGIQEHFCSGKCLKEKLNQ